jgi:hypothetical protein
MIADVLSVAGGPIWLPIVITIVALIEFVGIVIRVLRMKETEVERLSRLALDDSPHCHDIQGAPHGQI